jgi:ATP-dependent 26S proteasome regulatory subunit
LTSKIKDDIRLNTVSFLGDKKLASAGVSKRGLVMYGPPGTGKTSVVKAIFKELEGKQVSRIYVTSESFKRMAVSNLFDMLTYLGSTVLAFEDIDLVSGNRDIHTSSGLLGDLLTNLDGMRKYNDPFVVLASTNKIDMLDGALADRPGRFDRKILIGLPNDENLKKIYCKLIGSEVSVDDNLIKMSNKFTGSHVNEVVNTARIIAMNEGRQVHECLKDACTIVRDNFFDGQTTDQIKTAAKKSLKKRS